MPEQDGQAARKWTPEQRQAIETMARNVVVSAGAGSGKTGVLVERFLRIVRLSQSETLPPEQRAGVSNILVITFTDKATREVKGRIVAGLLAEGLRDERRQVETAYISTIHGFCSRLLKENPFEAGLPPDYKVLEEAEATRRLHLAVSHAVDEAFRSGSSGVVELVRMLQDERIHGRRSRDPLAVLALSVQHTLAALRGTGMRLSDLRRLLEAGPDELRSRSVRPIARVVQPIVTEVKLAAEALRTLKAGAAGALELVRQRLLDLANELPAPSPESATVGEVTGALDGLATINREAEAAARSRRVAASADVALVQVMERMRYLTSTVRDLFLMKEDAEDRAQSACLRMWELAYLAWSHYDSWKRSEGSLDNDDLQAEAAYLLESHPDVLQRYRRKLRHVMVDEFQDTSPVQMRIIRLITETDGTVTTHRFLVGDVQQSIYAFRNAMPALMAAELHRAQSEKDGCVIRLTQNFRSRPEILAFVNYLFGNIWKHTATEGQALSPGAAFDDCAAPCVEAMVGSAGHPALFRELQARAIAGRIHEMVRTQEVRITARDSPRYGQPIRYGDVALLLRAATHIETYEQAFATMGLPYYVVGGGRNYFARREVRDVVNALTVVDNPLDDLAFASTLRSPLVGVSAQALYQLRRFAVHECGERVPLFLGVSKALEQGGLSGQDAARLGEFISLLERLRTDRDRLKVGEILERLVRDSQYDARLLVRQNGRRRVANLRKLQQMAYAAANTGLSEFIDQLRDLETLALREGDAPTEEEAADVVRIFTIHRAKGLEFPVVVLADVSQPLERETRELFLCDASDLTMGCQIGGYKSLTFRAQDELRRRSSLEEEMRVLYVALTRAQEKLIICGQAAAKGRRSWAHDLLPTLGLAGMPSVPAEAHSPAGIWVTHRPMLVDDDCSGQPSAS